MGARSPDKRGRVNLLSLLLHHPASGRHRKARARGSLARRHPRPALAPTALTPCHIPITVDLPNTISTEHTQIREQDTKRTHENADTKAHTIAASPSSTYTRTTRLHNPCNSRTAHEHAISSCSSRQRVHTVDNTNQSLQKTAYVSIDSIPRTDVRRAAPP